MFESRETVTRLGKRSKGLAKEINGGLFWRGVTFIKGTLTFANAHTSVLCDDEGSWPSGWQVDLNGITYDTIMGGPLDAKTRLAWLHKGSNWNGEFTPQPYTPNSPKFFEIWGMTMMRVRFWKSATLC